MVVTVPVLHSPSFVDSIVGGVIEAGDGRAGGHHNLTLRSIVRDQSICRQHTDHEHGYLANGLDFAHFITNLRIKINKAGGHK